MSTIMIVLLAAAIFAVVYGRSLITRPQRDCRWCKGRGKFTSRVFPWAKGACWRCGGKGWIPRWGVRIFRPEAYRRMMAGRDTKETARRAVQR